MRAGRGSRFYNLGGIPKIGRRFAFPAEVPFVASAVWRRYFRTRTPRYRNVVFCRFRFVLVTRRSSPLSAPASKDHCFLPAIFLTVRLIGACIRLQPSNHPPPIQPKSSPRRAILSGFDPPLFPGHRAVLSRLTPVSPPAELAACRYSFSCTP